MTNAVCTWDFTQKIGFIEKEVPNDMIPKDMEITNRNKLIAKLEKECKKWSFQFERGASGYLHYQGRFSLKTKMRLNSVKELFKDWKDIHFSITSNENRDNNFYVMKEESRIAGPWTDEKDKPIYIPRQIREISMLYPWQQQVVDDADVWNKRTINILFDPVGDNGKSTLKTYIGVNKIGRAIPPFDNYKDIMRMIMNTEKRRLYIIDMPRALKQDKVEQLFGGIETLKDGYAFDDRYNFKEEYFDCPNIWVFTNKIYPDELLSKGRWKYWTIKNNVLVPYEVTTIEGKC